MPAMTGNTASTMGTAPRKPTQEMKAISCLVKRSGLRHSQTEIGRATSISTAATPKAGHKVRSASVGVTSNPSIRNIAAWESQAKPSMADSAGVTLCGARLATSTPNT